MCLYTSIHADTVYLYVSSIHIYIYMHMVYTCIYICACIHICIYICIGVYTSTSIYISTTLNMIYTYINTLVHAPIYVGGHGYIHFFIYMFRCFPQFLKRLGA